jgi:hypothetical protein
MMQRSETPARHSTLDESAPAGRRERMENRTPLLVLGVVLLVFLVALGSSRSLDHVAGPGDLAGVRLAAGDLLALTIAVIVIPAVLLVIWQARRELRDGGAPDLGRQLERTAIKLVVVIAVIGGALGLYALGRPTGAVTSVPPARLGTGVAPSPQAQSQLAETLAPWIVAAVAALLVVLLVAILILRRRRHGFTARVVPEDELESPRRELRRLVGISIEEIERESDPRRAVIRAYAGMESTLSRHGLGRHRFEAPGEYLSRVFGALRLSRRPAERLTGLFEQARFSEHAIGPEMKREAIAALRELRDELEAKPR